MLIDVVILANRNATQMETEKKLNYDSFCIEILRMWNMKCVVIRAAIGANGIVTKG